MDISFELGDNKSTTSNSKIIVQGTVSKEISPIKLGLLSDPPTLVLIYESGAENLGKYKRRKRKIPLRNFNDHSDVIKVVYGIQKRHSEYLQSIPSITLEKMIRIIQEIQKGDDVDEAVVKVHQEYEINPNQDLNKLSTIELSRKKEIMDETFIKTLIKPNDSNYIYNKQVDFEKHVKRENTWDDDDDDGSRLNLNPNPMTIGIENLQINTKEDKDQTQSTTTNTTTSFTPSNNTTLIEPSSSKLEENKKEYKPQGSFNDDEEIDDEDFW